eukprot:14616372-Heterocapsa_arctica.AAC.1
MVVALLGRLRVPEQQDGCAVDHVDELEGSPVGCRCEVVLNCLVVVAPGLRNVRREHVADPRRMARDAHWVPACALR